MEKKKEKSFYLSQASLEGQASWQTSCHMVGEESVRNGVRKSKVPEKSNLGAGQHQKETEVKEEEKEEERTQKAGRPSRTLWCFVGIGFRGENSGKEKYAISLKG